MSVQGYTQVVYVRTDTTAPGAADKIDGILEFSVSRSVDLEETTDTKDGTGYKTRQAQLKDSKIDMSGHFEEGDAVQDILRTAYGDGSTVYVTYHTDPSQSSGSKGFRVPCVVENYAADIKPGAAGTFSCSLQGNGAPVAV